MNYNSYLSSKHWKNKRSDVFDKKGECCFICFNDKNVHVHHIIYKDRSGKSVLFNEKTHMLVPLCARCHGLVHKYHDHTILSQSFFKRAKQAFINNVGVDVAIRFSNSKKAINIINGSSFIYGDSFIVSSTDKNNLRFLTLKLKGEQYRLTRGRSYYINEYGSLVRTR